MSRMSLWVPAAIIVGVLFVSATASRLRRQHALILAYRTELADLANQLIELRSAQHDAGVVVGDVDWPARVVDEFRNVQHGWYPRPPSKEFPA